jgi:hypothetical protein
VALQKLNPHQFALPGMEHLAHPLAEHLSKGYTFDFETEKLKGPPGQSWHHHALNARAPGRDHNPEHMSAARLEWTGSKDEQSDYPGHIEWAGNQDTRAGTRPESRGLARALFKAGHEMDFGQTTVPVHSPTRTHEGDKFAAKTNMPELTPRNNDFDWRPPEGIHPFEQAQQAKAVNPRAKTNPQAKGQQQLFDPNSLGRPMARKSNLNHVRDWASKNGHDLAPGKRIPGSVRDAYESSRR